MSTTTTIIGRPGTGKTTRLAHYVERAVTRFGPDNVVVASLTKTAAHEIASRSVALPDQDDPWHEESAPASRPIYEALGDRVGTLHAICYRALGRPPLVYDTVEEFNATYRHNLTAAKRDVDGLDEPDSERSGSDELLERMEVLRARRVPRDLWPLDVALFADKWAAWKEFTGTIDFSDMIEHALDQLPEGPCGPASAIFYDEAQDGSRLELDLLHQWSQHADHTVIVGDDLQSLYEWRGASVEAFLGWSEKRVMLPDSHRLPRSIHRAACRWAEQVECKAPGDYRPRNAEGEVRTNETVLSWPEDVLQSVQDDLDAGRRVMLLASCSYMLRPLLKVLRDRAVPFANPHRAKRGDWNPLRLSKRQASPAGRVLDFSRACDTAWGNDARPWTWAELARWAGVLDRGAIAHGAKATLERRKAEDAVVPFDDLAAILPESSLGPALAGDLEWYAAHVMASKADALRFPVAVALAHGFKALQEPPRLCVGTIHSVKGAESDSVYLWPDLSPAAWDEWESGARDPILRTFYVGLTRAREAVTLCAPAGPMAVEWWPVMEGER